MGPGLRRDDVGREYAFAISRHGLPELCKFVGPLENRGRRESRVPTAPAVSCAELHIVGAHEHTGSAETARPSPRNGFTAYFVLSPVSGLVCHRHPREVLLPGNLTPASRRQDHTTSPSAPLAFVSRKLRVHRIPPRV